MPHLGHLSVAILFAEICLESEFSCGDGSCIPLTQTCSGVAECLHGQDEIGCGKKSYMSPDKRICVFEHSVMTNFNCACPAIQRDHGSGFLSEGSS